MANANIDVQDNVECKSSLHNEHLCYIISQGFNLSDKREYGSLVENPQFRCEHCGRVAGSDKNLCKPRKL
ncbi:MAG: hypothetical protein ABSG82_02250 [Sedimentisphaerales bacterium]